MTDLESLLVQSRRDKHNKQPSSNKEQMIHVTMILEDSIVTATRNESHWEVTSCDALTGLQQTVTATDEQFGAAMALAVGGDEIAGSEELYPPAEQLMEKLQQEGDNPYQLRFIP
jgi:hypothetical protein